MNLFIIGLVTDTANTFGYYGQSPYVGVRLIKSKCLQLCLCDVNGRFYYCWLQPEC